MWCDWLLCSTPPLYPLSLILCLSVHTIIVLHLEERRHEWSTGKVTRGLRDKNQPDFYLRRVPGADGSRLLLPSNQEKKDEGCNVAAEIDSHRNLFLYQLRHTA